MLRVFIHVCAVLCRKVIAFLVSECEASGSCTAGKTCGQCSACEVADQAACTACPTGHTLDTATKECWGEYWWDTWLPGHVLETNRKEQLCINHWHHFALKMFTLIHHMQYKTVACLQSVHQGVLAVPPLTSPPAPPVLLGNASTAVLARVCFTPKIYWPE